MRLPGLDLLVIAALSLGLVSGVAAQPREARLVCGPQLNALELRQQRIEVIAALTTTEATYKAALDALDRGHDVPAAAKEAELEAAQEAYHSARRHALEPFVARGNAEAMRILAEEIRDQSTPEEIRRWFELTTCASARGDPRSDDELVRWYWHQRGDGAIAAVQSNRALALSFAAKAAEEGFLGSVARISAYVAGNRHQYPANIELARRVRELCARAGDQQCQEELVGFGLYNYNLSPASSYFWLSILATDRPERFARFRDEARGKLAPNELVTARRTLEMWRPSPWSELKGEWASIAQAILLYGEASIGTDTDCATSTPWCRGAALASK